MSNQTLKGPHWPP